MITGAILGALGSLGNQALGIYREKQQAKVEEKKRSDEYEKAKLNAGKAAIVESYNHDKTLGQDVSRWVANIRAMVRPVLTFYSLTIVTVFFFFTDVAGKAVIIASALEFSSMAGTWWFADRFKK